MQVNDVLKAAARLVTPSKSEEAKLAGIVREVVKKVNAEIKSQKIRAELRVGGSAAKGTWLPGISDIDFFLVFNYDDFSEKSSELPSYAERILRKAFRITRLHGSRDYFSARHKGYNIEIVPVLDISKGQKAKNITDYSVLHVLWLASQVRKKPSIKTEIRLAKQFFKVAGVYGAESYIRGFSGHVIEILTANYGGFAGLARAVQKWKFQEVIDVRKYYRSPKEVFQKLNKSKLNSAVILVDPVEKDRNAAAAFDQENFMLAKDICHRFFDNPSKEFFREKKFSVKALEKKDLKLIVVSASVKGKPDVSGAILRKKFEGMFGAFTMNDFVIQDSGKRIEGNSANFWFYFDKKPLPAKKLHEGPPVELEQNARAFRKKWKAAKVKNGRLVVEIKRSCTKPEQLVKNIARKDKSLSFKVY